jgi:hypothetical protein
MCNVCVADSALKNGFSRADIGYEVRAQGATEFGFAKYQIRRIGHEWPHGWVATTDLAGSLGTLGFDMKFSQINRRRFRLISEIALGLERGDLHCTYPSLAYVHAQVIWPGLVITKLQQVLRWVRSLGHVAGGVKSDVVTVTADADVAVRGARPA